MIIFDEGHLLFQQSPEEQLAIERLRGRGLSAGGWITAERFNQRFDTKVGGYHVIASQSLKDNKTHGEGVEFSKILAGGYPTERNTPVIIDYEDGGKIFTEQEASDHPEFQAVLIRLRKRIAEYDAYYNNKHA